MDGYIARNFPNQRSMLGSFLDPFADKLLVATLFLTLTYVELIPGKSGKLFMYVGNEGQTYSLISAFDCAHNSSRCDPSHRWICHQIPVSTST